MEIIKGFIGEEPKLTSDATEGIEGLLMQPKTSMNAYFEEQKKIISGLTNTEVPGSLLEEKVDPIKALELAKQ